MTPTDFLRDILDPGLAWCAAIPGWTIPSDDRARLLLLAIAGTESGWSERIQSGNGPAHGFWQFERNGGVRGVLTSATTKTLAVAACAMAPPLAGMPVQTPGVAPDQTSVWGLLATQRGDNLAVAFARLLLWTDPAPLPAMGAQIDALHTYLRLWRPGKPNPARFLERYREVQAALAAPTQEPPTA